MVGWGRDITQWTSTQLVDFVDILKRGSRMFYFPPMPEGQPVYEWTFLRTIGSITLVTGDYTYTLPDDFGGTILDRSVTWPVGNGNRMLTKISEQDIRKNQAYDNQSGVPKYYAVRNLTHAPTTGQRWELLTYPTPSAAVNGIVLSYSYVFVPNVITSANKYPVGGAQYSEVILSAILAAAEYKEDDDPSGPYHQKFQELLQVAMRNDEQQKSNDRKGKA